MRIKIGFITKSVAIAVPLAVVPAFYMNQYWSIYAGVRFSLSWHNFLIPALISLLVSILLDSYMSTSKREM